MWLFIVLLSLWIGKCLCYKLIPFLLFPQSILCGSGILLYFQAERVRHLISDMLEIPDTSESINQTFLSEDYLLIYGIVEKHYGHTASSTRWVYMQRLLCDCVYTLKCRSVSTGVHIKAISSSVLLHRKYSTEEWRDNQPHYHLV